MQASSPRSSRLWMLVFAVLLGLGSPLFAQLQYQMRLDDGGNQSARTINVGDTITLSVYATVSGTDGIDNEALQFAYGSILNNGGTLTGGTLGTFQLSSAFAANGSSAGTTSGMTIGPSSGATPSSAYIQARSSGFETSATSGTRVGQNTQFLLGTVTFTVSSLTAGDSTAFDFFSPTFTGLQRSSLFNSDGTVKNEINGTVGPKRDPGPLDFTTGITFNTGDATVYWKGGQGTGGQTSSWTTDLLGQTNFSDINGVNKGTLPGLSTEVIFQATGATNLSTTLDRDFSIRKLTFASTATAPVSISGNKLTIGTGGIEVQAGSGSHTIGSNVGLGANQTWNINSAGPITFTGVVSGGGNLTKTGTGTIILSGGAANIFTGTTTIAAGKVEARKDGALGATSAINVTGGTLLLGDTGSTNHRLSAANVTLGGGTLASERASLAANTITESLGTLTLTSNSTLDFGALGGKGGNTSLTFSGAGTLSGTLTILNWQGEAFTNSTLPTSDHLFFSDVSNIDGQLGQIRFIIDGQQYGAVRYGNEIIAAIPEPTTVGAAVLLVGVIGWRERRRLRVLATKTFGSRVPRHPLLS